MLFTFAFMGLNGKLDRSSVWYFLVVLTMMSFPWNSHLNSIGIILLVLHWLMDEKLVSKIKSFRITPLILSFWTYFFIHILYLIGTQDLNQGLQTIQVKLVFLILPVLFSTESYMNKEKLRYLMMYFGVSCFGALLFNFGHSYVTMHHLGWSNVLSRMNLAYTIWHPGVLSNYYCVALFFGCLEFLRNRNLSKQEKRIFFGMNGIFLIYIFLLISRTNMIIMVLFFAYLMWLISAFIKNGLIRVGIFVAFMTFVLFSVILIPSVQKRIIETKQTRIDKNITLGNSTGTRVVAYKAEWNLIKRNWILGYGTGDSNDLLKKELTKTGYTKLVVDGMNTHNQFFKTWIEFGLLGLLSFLGLLVLMSVQLVSSQNVFGVWTLCLMVFNCLTDDILEVQAGSVFFIFILSLLLFSAKQKERTYI